MAVERSSRGVWLQVLLPVEHGAWAFLAEPIALGLSPRRPRLTTTQLGVGEIAFGAATVLAIAAGYALRL